MNGGIATRLDALADTIDAALDDENNDRQAIAERAMRDIRQLAADARKQDRS